MEKNKSKFNKDDVGHKFLKKCNKAASQAKLKLVARSYVANDQLRSQAIAGKSYFLCVHVYILIKWPLKFN